MQTGRTELRHNRTRECLPAIFLLIEKLPHDEWSTFRFGTSNQAHQHDENKVGEENGATLHSRVPSSYFSLDQHNTTPSRRLKDMANDLLFYSAHQIWLTGTRRSRARSNQGSLIEAWGVALQMTKTKRHAKPHNIQCPHRYLLQIINLQYLHTSDDWWRTQRLPTPSLLPLHHRARIESHPFNQSKRDDEIRRIIRTEDA